MCSPANTETQAGADFFEPVMHPVLAETIRRLPPYRRSTATGSKVAISLRVC